MRDQRYGGMAAPELFAAEFGRLFVVDRDRHLPSAIRVWKTGTRSVGRTTSAPSATIKAPAMPLT